MTKTYVVMEFNTQSVERAREITDSWFANQKWEHGESVGCFELNDSGVKELKKHVLNSEAENDK